MEQHVDPMVQRRRLRTDLQALRTGLGLTQRQVAADLGWSLSKLLRVENGKVGVSRTDLKGLLHRYDVTDPEAVENYIRMAEHGRRQRWSGYRDVLNPEFFVYLEYEGSAARIRQFQTNFIPGLLQTEAYMRCLGDILAPDTQPDTRRRQLEVRVARQAIFEQVDPPQLHFLLDESTVRRWPAAGPDDASMRREQIDRLRKLAALPNVTIQIVPWRHGIYRGMQSPFALLDFPGATDPALLFRENGSDSVASRGDPKKTSEFADLFDELAEIATAPDQLADVLDRLPGVVGSPDQAAPAHRGDE
jgi:transcriptional regulator with XRE-family HTH domain